MSITLHENHHGELPPFDMASPVAFYRLFVGLWQGLLLYALYYSAELGVWPATSPALFVCLILVLVIVPVLMVSSLGHMTNTSLWLWMSLAAVLLCGLGYYDHWREIGAYHAAKDKWAYPSPWLCFYVMAGLFIAHALVQAGVEDKRYVASYPAYFESAWKLLIQLIFSQWFVTALWLVLFLGAGLFSLLKLEFFAKLIAKPYFFIPVTTSAFAMAVHLTDVRPAIIRGIRGLLLTLLSWILPVAVVIIGGFLFMLLVAGLEPLWATKYAASLLLVAAAALVIFINMVFQNGQNSAAVLLRLSARIACLLLLPLVAIAGYALALRVGDYGWTHDRVMAACVVAVASCYALGYAWAACSKYTSLARIAPVNVYTALFIVMLLLMVCSPVLDPARIAVNSQVARLMNGKESAEAFDYRYLRFDAARFGQQALIKLSQVQEGKNAAIIREKASQALASKDRWEARQEKLKPLQIQDNLIAAPDHPVPPTFLSQSWAVINKDVEGLPACLTRKNSQCHVYELDYNGDGTQELLVVPKQYGESLIFQQDTAQQWQPVVSLGYLGKCAKRIDQANIHSVPALLNDVMIGDQRVHAIELKNASSTQCK